MSINSILFTQPAAREPILLNIGSKDKNYENLADYLSADDSLASPASSAYGTDTVDISLGKVASKLISDLAGLTAETIADYPEFQDDYVLVIIDNGDGKREARVYSRDDIIEASGGTDEEKEKMREALKKDPLLVYDSADGLPESSTGEAARDLLSKVGNFLSTNEKLLNLLDSYGYNPLSKLKA
ncbi:MAG: hypothetical protein LBR53_11345 [Deltaproteobacteria bacterium]|nr:hypothetical protein [Deltaproteobacteria bacterium]